MTPKLHVNRIVACTRAPSLLPMRLLAEQGYALRIISTEAELPPALAEECPAVVLVVQNPAVPEDTIFRKVRGSPGFAFCCCLLVTEGDAPEACETGGADDVIAAGASPAEWKIRLQAGVRLAFLRLQAEQVSGQGLHWKAQAERSQEQADQTTRELVEMAAQLHAHIVRIEELEAEHIRSAQCDTIAQSAARLRHEINNPLFIITGNAELALKRLHRLAGQGREEMGEMIPQMERILSGAERLQEALAAYAGIVAPTTTDYVPGVAMLEMPQPGERRAVGAKAA